MNIAQNLAAVRQTIYDAAVEYGRDPGTIHLLAVSKTQPVEALQEAVAAGQKDFGENYLQDALPKIGALSRQNIHWHFIGPLQTNKTRAVAENFTWLHSLEKEKHARRLNEQRSENLPPLNVCIQVNISGEAQKAGVGLRELPVLARAVCDFPRLRLRGLMALPAVQSDFGQQREAFRRLRGAYDELCREGFDLDTLSMGMSNDMRAAIAEGATWVRIGTAIFGPRRSKKT